MARLTDVGSRTFEGTGEIILENGDRAVTGKGKYYKLLLDKITKHEYKSEEWFNIKAEYDPEEIDF